MSYPHLSPETLAACTQAAYDYDPACYCIFHWGFADFPPQSRYYQQPTKWVEVSLYRTGEPGQADRWVLSRRSDSGPEVLRLLREALRGLADGSLLDPSLLADDHEQQVLRAALCHPMLAGHQLLRALDTLLPRLPGYEARLLTSELHRAIDQGSREAQQPAHPQWAQTLTTTASRRPNKPLEASFIRLVK